MAIINGYSNYASAGVQNYIMSVTSSPYVPPVANDIYVGLCLATDPFQTSYTPGDVTSEPFGKLGYARAPAPSGDPSGSGIWSESAAIDVTEITNTASITFPVSQENWGDVYYFSVFDNSAGATGQLIWGAALTTHKVIEVDTVAVFTAGALVVKSRNT